MCKGATKYIFVGVLALAISAMGQREPTQYETYCSSTTPGDSVAEIRWPVQSAGGKSAMDKLVQQHTLDVTVYKNGFERGLYKTLQSVSVGRPFALHENTNLKEIPGLERVTLAEIATSRDAPRPNLRLYKTLVARSESQQAVVVRLEGLQPGMQYFWRVSAPGAAPAPVSFIAATCPVDWHTSSGK